MRRMSRRENDRGNTTGWSLQWCGRMEESRVPQLWREQSIWEKIRKNLKCTLKLSGEVETDRWGEKTRPYLNIWTQTRPWESVLLQLNHWWAAYKWCKVNRRWNQNHIRSEKTNHPPGESENAESLSRGTRNNTWVLLCCGETHSHSAE